jgi:PKHD-type hydroxylase
MKLNNLFWVFENAVPNRICDYILQHGKAQKEKFATTGESDDLPLDNKNVEKLKKVRNSKVVWLNYPWLYREIHEWLNLANRNAGWNFQWSSSESCQFTKYSGDEKQHYDWHTDSAPNPNEYGLIRKLSMSLSLVDGTEYEGGDFEVNDLSPQNNKIHQVKSLKKKGSIVVFPSFVWHRVTPITKGTRYSLVSWHLGSPHT